MNLSLIREAQRFVTGAEIHKVNGLIAMIIGCEKSNPPDRRMEELYEAELERIVSKIKARRL